MAELPPPTAIGWIDWVVVGVSLAAAVLLGLLIAKRASGSLENYFLAGRSLHWTLVGTSLAATAFSSDTPLLITNYTRNGGVAGNWRWWGYAVGTVLVAVVFSRLWRRSGVLTDVEFMELRYSGKPAAVLRGVKGLYHVLFLHGFVMGWVLLSMQKLVEVILELDPVPLAVVAGFQVTPAWLWMVGLSLLTLLYTDVSGLWGAAINDFVQYPVALAGAVALLVGVVHHFGGVAALTDALASSPHAPLLADLPSQAGELVGTSPAAWSPPAWELFVFLGLLWCATKNADGGGMIIQRMLAARDERHSLLGVLWYALANFAVRTWPWIVVALASLLVLPGVHVAAPCAGTVTAADARHVVVQPAGDAAPVELVLPPTPAEEWPVEPRVTPGESVEAGQLVAATDDERAYPVMMRRFLPAGWLGLMLASFLAAFMSTIDSHLNLASAYVVNDVYKRFVRPDADGAHYVRVARWTGPFVLLLALLYAGTADSVGRMFDIFSALFGGVGVAYLLRWTWWRVNVWSEVAALGGSALVTGLLAFWPGAFVPLLPPGLVARGGPTFAGELLVVFVTSIVLVVTVTLLTPPVPLERLVAFYERVRPPGAWGPVRRAARAPDPEGTRDPGLLRQVLAWIGGLLFIFGCLFVPGRLLLHGGAGAGWWAVTALAGLLLLVACLPELRAARPRHGGSAP